MSKKISIFIPVYKLPKFANDMISKLLDNDYKNKEIIIIVDGEPNKEIEESISPYKDKIKIIYNAERLGKSASLNKAVSLFGKNSDLYLFMDNDIELSNNKNFISNLVNDLETHDLAEIPKESRVTSFLSKVMFYEFFTFEFSTYVVSKINRQCPAMSGAAFAIKKELFEKLGGFRGVINEDMDLAARAFKIKAKFSYNRRLKIKVDPQHNLHDWFQQRKRWLLTTFYG